MSRRRETIEKMRRLDAMEAKTAADIANATENAIKMVKQREKEMQDELTSVTDKEMEKLKQQQMLQEADLKVMKQKLAYMDLVMRKGDDAAMLELFLMCKDGDFLEQPDRGIQEDISEDVLDISFEKCDEKGMAEILHIGDLKIDREEPEPVEPDETTIEKNR